MNRRYGKSGQRRGLCWATFAVAGTLLGGAQATSASEVPFHFIESFAGDAGGLPEHWVALGARYSGDGLDNGTYNFGRRTGDSSGTKSIGYAGLSDATATSIEEQPFLWQDYTITAEFTYDADPVASVTARMQGGDGSFGDLTDGYAAYLWQATELRIGAPSPDLYNSTPLAALVLDEPTVAGQTYRLVFTVTGDLLEAQLYHVTGDNAVLVGEVSTQDDTYEAGAVGMQGRLPWYPRNVAFSRFEVQGTAIPEPASAALLGLGGLMLVSRGQHKAVCP